MKKYIAILCAVLCLAVIFCSCDLGISEDETEKKAGTSATTTTPSENVTESESEPTSSSASESETPAQTEPAPTRATYKVIYVFNGEPVENATVQLCNGALCLPPVFTDANGTAIFENVKIAEYSATITTPDGQSMEFDATDFEYSDGCYELVISAETEE